MTLGHEKPCNPTITMVFEQRGTDNTPFRTLICLATDCSLDEIKQLLARSTLRRTGCNLHVDNISVDMPTELAHAVIVHWHVNKSLTCPPISEHWMRSLQPRQRSADSTYVLMIQWDDNTSFVGVHEYNTIKSIMDMVSVLTQYHTCTFRLQAQSGGRTTR
jgi:hypothetical protein